MPITMRCVERRFPFESERLSPPVVFPDWLQQRKFGLLAGSQKHAESNGFKDSISLIYRMKLDRCFEAHDGCVNTIFWNQSGKFNKFDHSGNDLTLVLRCKIF